MNEGGLYNMKWMRFRLCFGLLIATIIAGCSFISVNTEHDPNINFANYQTFKWMPQTDRTGNDPVENSSLFTKRLQYAVNQTLTAKGYRKEPSDAADFLITYHISLNDKVEVTDYGYGYGGFRGRSARYNNYWGAPINRNIDVYQYTEARLILDFVDSKSKELIWRGLASGVVDEYSRDDKDLNEAVKKMLDQFPPMS
jgi:hypothetical protein